MAKRKTQMGEFKQEAKRFLREWFSRDMNPKLKPSRYQIDGLAGLIALRMKKKYKEGYESGEKDFRTSLELGRAFDAGRHM